MIIEGNFNETNDFTYVDCAVFFIKLVCFWMFFKFGPAN